MLCCAVEGATGAFQHAKNILQVEQQLQAADSYKEFLEARIKGLQRNVDVYDDVDVGR